MLGDHNFTFYLASFYGYRSYHLAYLNQQRRLQLYAHLFSESDAYYYPYVSNFFLSLRSRIGAEFAMIYPFSRSTRIELALSAYHQEENSDLLYYQQELPFGQFFNGFALPVSASLLSETTSFANYGPNRGHTFRLERRQVFQVFIQSAGRLYPGRRCAQVPAPRQLFPSGLAFERILFRRKKFPALLERRQQYLESGPIPQPGRQPGILIQRRVPLPPGSCRPDPHRHHRPGARRIFL